MTRQHLHIFLRTQKTPVFTVFSQHGRPQADKLFMIVKSIGCGLGVDRGNGGGGPLYIYIRTHIYIYIYVITHKYKRAGLGSGVVELSIGEGVYSTDL